MSEARIGMTPLGDAVDAVMTILERIQRTNKVEPLEPWWGDVNHEDYDMVVKLFVAPFGGAVKMTDVDAYPLAFDHALRQAKVCQRCQNESARMDWQGNTIGMAACQMGKVVPKPTGKALPDGTPEVVFEAEGVDSRYAEVRPTHYGWHWELMLCTDSDRRKSRLAERLGQFTHRAGNMPCREVDDNYGDAGTTGGQRRAGR